MTEQQSAIEALAAELGITMTAQFVPFSQSRNRGEKQPSLNWKITLARGGREILTTDYSAGCAHCPSYVQNWNGRTIADDELVRWECEHGRRASFFGGRACPHGSAAPILPDLVDVLSSLAMDAGALDYSTFEDWASDTGYDPDSRKAEAIYRACLETGLKLRNGIGEDGLRRLREALQDY